MENITVSSWEEFEVEVRSLDVKRAQLVEDNAPHYVSDLLFRGQADANWSLSTTLERQAPEHLGILDYYRTVMIIKTEIESFTGRKWDTMGSLEYTDYLSKNPDSIVPRSYYEYMVHLRHHGFPSPLLDWTTSPFIAAFFAFQKASPDAASVAVYAYLGYSGRMKTFMGGAPIIDALGPNVRTHSRHFLQRSQYTICVEHRDDTQRFCSHESVFAHESRTQDLLWKLEIPVTLRPSALKFLDRVNINAFSLFGSEEALMESCAIREFVL